MFVLKLISKPRQKNITAAFNYGNRLACLTNKNNNIRTKVPLVLESWASDQLENKHNTKYEFYTL